MFDLKYYEDKKTKLQQKAQQIQNEYLQNAFKFTAEINDIFAELNKIEEWIKENPPKKEEIKPAPKK